METKHWIVKGKVQGVGFRFSTIGVARELELTGWVRNLTTGEVEVLASGETESIDRLESWLKRGPSSAKVTEVNATTVTVRPSAGFVELPDASRPDPFAR